MKSNIRWTTQAACVLAGIAIASGAQAASFADAPLSYRSKNGGGQEINLHMPFVKSDDKQVADRINTLLHDQLLNLLPKASTAAGRMPSVMTVTLSPALEAMESGGIKLLNGGRTLAVSVHLEACGAYCSEDHSNYDFDTRSGRLLVQQELLSPTGRLAIAKLAAQANAARLKQEIARLNKLIAAAKRSKERSLPELQEQVELYEHCLQERYVKGGDLYAYYMKDPGVMAVGEASLEFIRGECAAHVNRALDDLGAFRFAVKGDLLRPHLTDYGKYLLFGEGNAKPPVINPYAQIFKGSINGSIAVTLYLGASVPNGGGGPFENARYYYDKFGKAIELAVKRNGDQFELTESDSKERPQPALQFRIVDGKLIGHWRGGGKTYRFEAVPH